MKLLAGVLVVVALASGAAVAQDVYVDGYYRSDGTYVQPHYRSSPDGDPSNNWSTQGNFNPYTGEQGTANPYDGGSTYQAPSYGSSQGDLLFGGGSNCTSLLCN